MNDKASEERYLICTEPDISIVLGEKHTARNCGIKVNGIIIFLPSGYLGMPV